MARLKLKNGISVHTVGKFIFALGGRFKMRADEIQTDNSTRDTRAKRQNENESDIARFLFDGRVATQSQGNLLEKTVPEEYRNANTIVRFHYDRQFEGKNLVNIVVPEIKGDLMDALVAQSISEFGENLELIHDGEINLASKGGDDFDLDDYAYESLGSVVILSCHS